MNSGRDITLADDFVMEMIRNVGPEEKIGRINRET
jgi:hypothetical protein